MVTTAFTLDGYTIVRNLGLVRGIIVRSRSIVGTIGATLQTIVGGNITLLTNLCEQTREHAFDLMLQHAAELGANAVDRDALRRDRGDAGRNRSPGLRNRSVRGKESLVNTAVRPANPSACQVVSPAGIEPATHALKVRCSTN